MVYGHVNPGLGLAVGLFHMPLFFFLGGLTLSPERPIKKVARFVLVDTLLFAVAATFFYSIVAAALEPLGLKFRYFSDWSPTHFTVDILRHASHHVGFAITTWFLVAYAGAVVVAELATRTIRLKHGTLLVLTALAVLMFYFGVRIIAPLYTKDAWYWNWVSQVSVGGAFMIAGYVAMRSGRLTTLTTSVAWVAVTYLSDPVYRQSHQRGRHGDGFQQISYGAAANRCTGRAWHLARCSLPLCSIRHRVLGSSIASARRASR